LKKAGAGNPAGRSYHAAFGPSDKLMVFEVWTSQAAFDKFGKTLMPILQQVGIDPGKPMVMPMHKAMGKCQQFCVNAIPVHMVHAARAASRRPG
jgi:hypothetical protein